MDLNWLVIFNKVAELGSFTGAAVALGMPKSAVSTKVSQLETHLGTRLLQRTTRRISLTAVGEQVHALAQEVASQAERVEELAGVEARVPQGALRISAPHDLGLYLISNVIGPFREKYPMVQIALHLESRYVDLVNEGFDMALRATSSRLTDSSLIVRKLADTNLSLFASAAFVKAHGIPETAQELAKFSLIGFAPHGARPRRPTWTLLSGKAESTFSFNPALLTNDMMAAKAAALESFGIALLPAFLCRQEHKTGHLVPILQGWQTKHATFYAVLPSNQFIPARVRVFVDELQDHFKAHMEADCFL